MAESSDPCLCTKQAQRGTGAAAVDGVLLITKTKLKWQPLDPPKAQAVVIDVAAITRTQQAPGKPIIKVDTATGPLILGFAAVGDRDDVVDLLKQLRPAGGAAGGKESKVLLPSAEQAAALFRDDPDLESVYKSLVVAGILKEPEFWASRQQLLKAAGGAGGGPGGGAAGGGGVRQRLGLPSAMLADVKPSADGQTEKVHFQLTPPIIQQIFTEKPEVHRAFLAHVPHTLDEKAFWTRYFKQQYRRMARRRRQGLPMEGDDDDEDELFAPFSRQLQEQERQRNKEEVGRVDPTVNLAADAGERFTTGGFGSARDAGSDPQAALRRSHLDSIARDINRHAAIVLEGAPEGLAALQEGGGGAGAADGGNGQQPTDTASIAAAIAAQQKAAAAAKAKGKAPVGASAPGGSSGKGGKEGAGPTGAAAQRDSVSPERLEEWQRRAASALEDLRLDDKESSYVPLSIQDPRAYFDAGAGASAMETDAPGAAEDAAAAAAAGGAAAGKLGSSKAEDGKAAGPGGAAGLLAALSAIQPLALPDPPCDPGAAASVVLELSQDQDSGLVEEFGPLAASALQYPPQDRAHGLPPLLLEHLRGEALKTNELLRHFYGCLPLVSAARADKAGKLAGHLGEQRTILVSHMRHPAGAGSSHQVHVSMMLRPLVAAIDAAVARHQAEMQQRRKAPP